MKIDGIEEDDAGTYIITDKWGITSISTHGYRKVLSELLEEEVKKFVTFKEKHKTKHFKRRFNR